MTARRRGPKPGAPARPKHVRPAAPAAGGGRPGLVRCAISGRKLTDLPDTEPDDDAETPAPDTVPDSAAGLWTLAFPSPELVDTAAAILPAVREPPGTLAEGPRWELTVGSGPGAAQARYARAWGEEWACVWTLEFQRRGAPHVHMLCTPPHGVARTTGQSFAAFCGVG